MVPQGDAVTLPAGSVGYITQGLGGMPAGWPRPLLAVAATVAMIVAVQWLVASAHIGAQMGLAPWQAAPKMGANYVWTLTQLANTWLDLAWLALAPLLALWAAR